MSKFPVNIRFLTISKDDPNGLHRTLQSTSKIPDNVLVVLGDESLESESLAKQYTENLTKDRGSGISQAFNLALSQTREEFVVFLNGGDTLLSSENLMIGHQRMAENLLVDITIYDAVFSDCLIGDYLYKADSDFAHNFSRIGLGMPCSHQAMLIRRTCFDQIGGFNPSYKVAMDYEWLCRWVRLRGKERIIEKIDGPPIVKVDGSGVSVLREPLCLYESFRALKENQLLSLCTLAGYTDRLTRFLVRFMLQAMGLNFLIVAIKRKKHGVK